MSESIMIRHSAYQIDWTQLNRAELEKLVSLETDPGVDREKLEEQLDTEKLEDQNFSKIYTSPLKRARHTAQKISEILKLPVEEKRELKELEFDEIPEKIFQKGDEAVRQYLLDRTRENSAEIEFIREKKEEDVLMVSHGFKMRLIYQQLFEKNFKELRDDTKFREYLTGFNLETGETETMNNERI